MKAVILAAGESSRFEPLSDKRHKSLFSICGESLIFQTINGLAEHPEVSEIIVVQGPERDIENELGDEADHFVVQEEPRGMGHALEQTKHLLDEEFIVLNPYRSNTMNLLDEMIRKQSRSGSDAVLLTTETESPEKYGVLDFEENNPKRIVEKPEASEAPSNQRVVGMYLLNPEFLKFLEETDVEEYQFEKSLNKYLSRNEVVFKELDEEPGSIKYPWDLFDVVKEIIGEKEEKISEKADIADSAEIMGKVIVEENAKIHENAVIKGPAYVGRGATVGNNSVIRNFSVLEENTTVGANAEVKNSVLQPGSSMHSGYLGDTLVGRNTKIGAGTVVANKNFRDSRQRTVVESKPISKDTKISTGRRACGAFIGDNVDIGVNVSIMPGVQIRSDSKVYPGSVVNENIDG